jgi:hypothetical protein
VSRRRDHREGDRVAERIRLKGSVTLRHQANLGEDVSEVNFEEGNELQVLQTYRTAWLVKDEENRLFNIKKELAEEI